MSIGRTGGKPTLGSGGAVFLATGALAGVDAFVGVCPFVTGRTADAGCACCDATATVVASASAANPSKSVKVDLACMVTTLSSAHRLAIDLRLLFECSGPAE